MISDELLNYFDYSVNAIFAVHEGKIEYCNPAARRLFPKIRTSDDDSVLTQGVTVGNAPSVISTAICGKPCSASVSQCGNDTVYTVFDLQEHPENIDHRVIIPVCAALRDALATMKISGDLLDPYFDELKDEKAARYVAAIAQSYNKMARIVGNLSHLENLRSDSKPFVADFDLASLCRELCEIVSTVTPEKGVRLIYDGPEADTAFSGSAAEIERLLLNLLSNSYKYTPKGGEITVSLRNAKQFLLLSVEDNGSGMSDEELASAFRRYQSERKLDDAKRGVGLGLSVVRNIAEEHGGSVFIESRIGEGTKVTVSLPIRTEKTGILHTSAEKLESDGMRTVLVELSDILSYESYMSVFRD